MVAENVEGGVDSTPPGRFRVNKAKTISSVPMEITCAELTAYPFSLLFGVGVLTLKGPGFLGFHPPPLPF